jgi:hypothetical protein
MYFAFVSYWPYTVYSSATGHTLCIRQIREKKWDYKEAVHQIFIDFSEACDSVRRDVLYDIVLEFGILVKVVGLITRHALHLQT